MKTITVSLALLALAVPAAGAGAAPPAFSDQLCPEATQTVQAVQALTVAADPQKIYDTALAASNAYDGCAKRWLGDQNIEPGAHYARTREAQFGVLAGRALVALKRPDDARREFTRDRALASDVASWEVAVHGVDAGVQTNSDSKYSRWRPTALLVVEAADDELKKLDASPAAASPKP